MRWMIPAEVVTVISREPDLDDIGDPVGWTETRTDVSALVAPGATADLDASRPTGVTASFTLHFPRGWRGSLRGCSIEVRGEEYAVVGDPRAYTDEGTPGDYTMPVEVTRVDG